MNRVINGIAKFEKVIAEKLDSGSITKDKLADLQKSLDMDFDEYCKFQTTKSLASMDGRLSLDEAQTVYMYLGNTPEHFNNLALAPKYVLTEVWSSLLKSQIV